MPGMASCFGCFWLCVHRGLVVHVYSSFTTSLLVSVEMSVMNWCFSPLTCSVLLS